MDRLSDGSVTLSKREWVELGKAYADIFEWMSDGPHTWEDAFVDVPRRMWAIRRWSSLLKNEPFHKSDWQ